MHPAILDMHPDILDMHPVILDMHSAILDMHSAILDIHPDILDINPAILDMQIQKRIIISYSYQYQNIRNYLDIEHRQLLQTQNYSLKLKPN